MPLTDLLVRLDQHFAIDPCSPPLPHLATGRVTSLEPRTPYQPGKLQKVSKNEFVVLLLFLQSMKSARLYLLAMQSSAGGSQGGELKIVQWDFRS